MADSQSASNIFSVRIVSIDYYMAPPIPGLDICYSSFQGGKVNEVPVIRIYGSTPAGQKTCLHLHQALPYLYVPHGDIALQPNGKGDVSHAISLATENALKLKCNTGSKRQHVHSCSLVRAKKLYGYHSSEELFVKICLYYPHDISRAANLLLGGAVLDKSLQPHEAHIPFILQFMVDYNLYGMGYIHLSKMKFRYPVPDVFSPKKFTSNSQHIEEMDKLTSAANQDSNGNYLLNAPVWISSTIPSDWIWQFHSEFDASSDQGIHGIKRQSVCELEGDAIVDDILNQQFKMYSSLSQTHSHVKMVQSLIPIWEEYERTGIHEVEKPPDPRKPLPEDVLKILSLGFEFENIRELCGEAETLTFLPCGKDVSSIWSTTAPTEERTLIELKLNSNNTGGNTLEIVKERDKIENENGAVPATSRDACPKLLSGDELQSSEMIQTLDSKNLDEEALGLLRWLSTSQRAEDTNSDDELVCETALSPFFPATTLCKVLEKANTNYENESQQECQDILDSIEDVIDFEGINNEASPCTDSKNTIQCSSKRLMPQVDGSSNDLHSSLSSKSAGNPSAMEMKIESKRSSQHQIPQETGTSFATKHKKSKLLWGSLPFSSQKPNEETKNYLYDTCSKETKGFVGTSFSAGNKVEECTDVSMGKADIDAFDSKGTNTLVGCSLRDLMRKKRYYRIETPESESQRVKKIFMDEEKREDGFILPKQLDLRTFHNDGHDIKPHGSLNFSPQSIEELDFHEASRVTLSSSTDSKTPFFSHSDCSFQPITTKGKSYGSREEPDDEVIIGKATRSGMFRIAVPFPAYSEKKEISGPLNSENQDSSFSIENCETYNCKESDFGTSSKALSSDVSICQSDFLCDVQFMKFDTEHKLLADDTLQNMDSPGSRCLSCPVEGEKIGRDGSIWRTGHKCRTSMTCVGGISYDNQACIDATAITTVLQDENYGGEQGRHTSVCGLGRSSSIPAKMAEKPRDLSSMLLCKKPPTAERRNQASETSLLGTTYPNRPFLGEKSNKGTSERALDEFLPPFHGNCQEKKEVQDKGLSHVDSDSHKKSVIGIPTHYQKDGSDLRPLTLVFKAPAVDSVRRWLLCGDEGSSSSMIDSHVRPIPGQLFLETCGNLVTEMNTSQTEVTPGVQNDGNIVKVKSCPDCSEDISQISGPDERSRLTPLSQIGFRDPASVGGGQQLMLFSIEVQAESRGNLRPDPRFDAINIIALAIQNDNDQAITLYVLLRSKNEYCLRSLDGVSHSNVLVFSDEKQLFTHFMKILCLFDPDILMGWDIQGGSLGFLAERASHLGIGLLNNISRTPPEATIANGYSEISEKREPDNVLPELLVGDGVVLEDTIIEDEWGRTHASGVHVGGRVVLNVWRLMRGELKLNMYSVEAVTEAVLRRKVPSIHYKVLTKWYSSGPGRARYRCIEYVINRAKLNLELMSQLDMINRTSELARVFGIDFFSVLSRGSQYRVESMLLRLAHTQNYLAISPGNQQVALQPAMECLPLVMEPESGFYADPVVVLDFQSLYPSMIIAYNLCFCTCLGKVVPSKANTLGVCSFAPDPHDLRNVRDQILLTPNGVMYVPSKVRKGILPRLLEEILSTRIMVKQAIKKLAPSQKILHRVFDARQLALKLIANVTYGYTAAGFSGRMPCAELADSIVQCGRKTLENAISFVNAHNEWKAKVIYGDTDSMFVLLKGRTVKEAFQVGQEIASAVSAMNPYPVTLKMEKVYHPCFLLTKKRYVGYSYESPDQSDPVFDAKGIETIRRDTCGAVAKTMQQSLRLFFEHQDIFEVKAYLLRQWTRILSGRVSLQDFVFAKEVRLGTYSKRASSSIPPAAIVATKAMSSDPRAEPCYGERIPYVVIHGEPGARLVDMVVDPLDLLAIDSPFRLNDLYYINKQIIPALQRVFGLVGADLNQWFSEMPRPGREGFAKRPMFVSNPHRTRIDYYYLSKHCILCGELVQGSAHVCNKCSQMETAVAIAVIGKTSKLEKHMQHLAAICRHCGGGDWLVENGVKCTSLACSVFYERMKVQKELQGISTVAADKGFYPKCMVEWF